MFVKLRSSFILGKYSFNLTISVGSLPRVCKEITGDPQEFHASFLHQLGSQVHQLVKVSIGLKNCLALRSQITVMESPVLVAWPIKQLCIINKKKIRCRASSSIYGKSNLLMICLLQNQYTLTRWWLNSALLHYFEQSPHTDRTLQRAARP